MTHFGGGPACKLRRKNDTRVPAGFPGQLGSRYISPSNSITSTSSPAATEPCS